MFCAACGARTETNPCAACGDAALLDGRYRLDDRLGDGASGIALVDFGSVKDALSGVLGGSTVAGTFGYMAPEQFRGDATPRTDVYGCGALAVALLSREDPKDLLDTGGHIAWHEHLRLPGPVASLLDSLLAPDPLARPTAEEAIRRIRLVRKAPGERTDPDATPIHARVAHESLPLANPVRPDPEVFEPLMRREAARLQSSGADILWWRRLAVVTGLATAVALFLLFAHFVGF